jgi:hypothetical protein
MGELLNGHKFLLLLPVAPEAVLFSHGGEGTELSQSNRSWPRLLCYLPNLPHLHSDSEIHTPPMHVFLWVGPIVLNLAVNACGKSPTLSSNTTRIGPFPKAENPRESSWSGQIYSLYSRVALVGLRTPFISHSPKLIGRG